MSASTTALTLYDLTRDIVVLGTADRTCGACTLDERVRGGYLTADGETLLEALPDGIRVWDLRPRRSRRWPPARSPAVS